MARPRQVSNSQILEATRRVALAAEGRITLEQVALRLGVTAPALLRRFGSRELLLSEALKPESIPEFLATLPDGPRAGAPLASQLEALLAAYWSFLSEMLPRLLALRELGLSCANERGEMLGKFIKRLSRWVDLGLQRGVIREFKSEPVAFAMLGALLSRAVVSHLINRSTSARSQQLFVKELAAFFAAALGASGGGTISNQRAKRTKRGKR